MSNSVGYTLDDAFTATVQSLQVPEMGTDSTARCCTGCCAPAPAARAGSRHGVHHAVPGQGAEGQQGGVGGREGAAGHAPVGGGPAHGPRRLLRRAVRAAAGVHRPDDRPTSSAPRALKILQELEIADVCEVIEGDLRGSSGRVREAVGCWTSRGSTPGTRSRSCGSTGS
ncbi:hypothetical protein NKH77_54895 [Streptomyces sp. M19]